MLSPNLNKTARMIVFGLTVAGLLAGCDPVQQQTGLNKTAQTGGVAGAALGGVVAAMALANPPVLVASVVIGSVAGGALGNFIHKEDEKQKGGSPGATSALDRSDRQAS